jgi:hypothetical protein
MQRLTMFLGSMREKQVLSSHLFQGRITLALFSGVDCLFMVANHLRPKNLLVIGASSTLASASGSEFKFLRMTSRTITNRFSHSS